MRLSKHEISVIKSSILALDPEAKIYLFGSRVDAQKKGGDIDLLVLSKVLSFKDTLSIRSACFRQFEEQKLDILISKDATDPFVQQALKKGVLL